MHYLVDTIIKYQTDLIESGFDKIQNNTQVNPTATSTYMKYENGRVIYVYFYTFGNSFFVSSTANFQYAGLEGEISIRHFDSVEELEIVYDHMFQNLKQKNRRKVTHDL